MLHRDHTITEQEWLVRLTECTALFVQGGEARTPAMLYALGIAIEQLRDSGATEKHLLPLIALLHGLDQLNHGRQVPALEPRKNAPPDRVDGAFSVHQAQALIVGEIIYSSMGGKRGVRRKADAEAADILAKAGFKTHAGRPLTKDVLRQWRSDLTDVGEEFAILAENFNFYLSTLPEQIHTDAAVSIAGEFARAALKHPAYQLS